MTEADPRIDAIWQALRTVIDPEIGLDLVTLGLIYGVAVVEDTALITHTLTTRGCPMQAIITEGILDAMSMVEGIQDVDLRLVWDPAWHPGMIARAALG